MTMLDTQAKTYTVTPFGELGKGLAQQSRRERQDRR